VAADGRAVPEFETMSHFSALLENTDLDVVMQANAICNAHGMDTISAAGALAALAESRGRPLASAEIPDILTDMALGRGEGGALGRGDSGGTVSADANMAVKGMALPAYDPRGAYGMALAYATSTRGGCHLQAYPIAHEILRKPVATDRFSFEGKARIIKIAEDANAMADSLTACKFVFLAASLEEYARVFAAVTGIPAEGQDLLTAGERVVYRERMINARNGFDARHDDLPRRFFSEAGSGSDGLSVPPLDRETFLAARANYFRVRGLTPEGRPTRKTAAALGLSWRD
jgi:aldehyde:ferredoxin oxidoreductase